MFESFFGFRIDPFQLTPNPRFLHLAESHRNALVALLDGIVRRKGVMLLTGPIGTGKTMLLHTLLSILAYRYKGERRIPSAMIVNPTLTRQEFLETVLLDFEIVCPVNTKPRQLLALHDMVFEVQRRGSTAVLIIDEAHLLSRELLDEVRLLSNLETYSGKPLQIVLCAQPELIETLGTPGLAALRQRIAVRSQLRSLSASETRAYIAGRLHAAGLCGVSPFPGDVVEQIYWYSQGVPRLINLLCDGCLNAAFHNQRKQVGMDLVMDVAGLLLPSNGNPARVGIRKPGNGSANMATTGTES